MSEGTSLLSQGVVIAETYEVERPLGRGGMGEVWLARHRRLAGKQVAIKVLHVDAALPQEALARFRREAEIAARLEHPNIVQVLDFNALPTGQPYLVMEYLKGQSLAARAGGRPMTLEQVTAVMRQVSAALQAAHRAGVVHRDLKPENIFLVPTALGDQVKVLDFGISKLSDSKTVQTTDAVLIGTPLYMSPEQALGHNSDVTAQSDLFSLGSICFELFTGQAPFNADSIAKVVFRIAYEKPPSLAAARPDLPPSVVQAVEHALEKERPQRTRDIESFLTELTGQTLAQVPQDESSGVFKPGMPMTPSMVGGATRAPSSGPLLLATPPPSVAQVDGPPPARLVSGKKVIIGILLVTGVIGAVISKTRMDNWAERERYRAGMRDAGYVMLSDGNFVMDAGVKAAVVIAEVIDAGLEEEDPDAGLEVVDAGIAAVRPKVIEAPPTHDEQELLKYIAGLEKAGNWETLWETRSRLRADLKTPSARARGFAAVVLAACARSDNAQLMVVINELKSAASSSQVRAVKQQCIAKYPSAEYLNW